MVVCNISSNDIANQKHLIKAISPDKGNFANGLAITSLHFVTLHFKIPNGVIKNAPLRGQYLQY